MTTTIISRFTESSRLSLEWPYLLFTRTVNLIGEHTDLFFPAAITLGTYGAARKREDKVLRFFSGNFEDRGSLISTWKSPYWKRAQLDQLSKERATSYRKLVMSLIASMDVYVYSNIPNGSVFLLATSLELLIGVITLKLYDLRLDRLIWSRSSKPKITSSELTLGSWTNLPSVWGNGLFTSIPALEYDLVPLDLKTMS